MKTLIYSLKFLALAMIMFSCQKDDASQLNRWVDPAVEKGTLEISFSMGGSEAAPQTRTTVSGHKPTTEFKEGDKIVVLFFSAGGTGGTERTVEVVQYITVPAGGVPAELVLGGVPVGSIGIMAIMNYADAIAANINDKSLTGTSDFLGKTVEEITFKLNKKSTTHVTDVKYTNEIGGLFYSPKEVFSSVLETVSIVKGENAKRITMDLARSVSLFRTRIKEARTDNVTGNPLNFASANNYIVLRRGAEAIKLSGTVTPGIVFGEPTDGVSYKGAYSTVTTAPEGYVEGGDILADADNGAFAGWQDFVIFPNTGAIDHFDILLAVHAPMGYMSKTGATTAEGLVYFSTEVKATVAANTILQASVVIKGAGSQTIPTVFDRGTIKVTVSISDWGTITNVDVPIN